MKVELRTQAQKEEALDVLCDAFHEYPVMRCVLADSGPDYDGDLRALIDLFCQARLGRYDDACEAGDPGQPSHYLGMLGIVSSHQR